MKYNLCIPIPIKYANIEEVRPIIDKTIKSKPNLIELRFDYISNIEKISFDFVIDLLNIIKPNIAVIFTLRDSSEGGKLNISQKERFKILKLLIETKPDYLDIEMNTEKKNLDELIKLALQNEVRIIFSYHNFENTLAFDKSLEIVQNFNEKLVQELSLDSKIFEDVIYKVIFTAQKFEDNLVPLKLCKDLFNSNQKIISFCMGDLGIFSRIMCVLTGSFLTYASLEEKTAPGQISFKKMKEIYALLG
ncbi:MAG: type I 3-dehydroquinate dehydratase [Candidatus Hodarchaeota archaeon]